MDKGSPEHLDALDFARGFRNRKAAKYGSFKEAYPNAEEMYRVIPLLMQLYKTFVITYGASPEDLETALDEILTIGAMVTSERIARIFEREHIFGSSVYPEEKKRKGYPYVVDFVARYENELNNSEVYRRNPEKCKAFIEDTYNKFVGPRKFSQHAFENAVRWCLRNHYFVSYSNVEDHLRSWGNDPEWFEDYYLNGNRDDDEPEYGYDPEEEEIPEDLYANIPFVDTYVEDHPVPVSPDSVIPTPFVISRKNNEAEWEKLSPVGKSIHQIANAYEELLKQRRILNSQLDKLAANTQGTDEEYLAAALRKIVEEAL